MSTEDHSDTLVVIPTYCEKDNIGGVLAAVLDALPCEVLVVDDDSPDGTAEEVASRSKSEPRIHLLVRRGLPRGLGPAYRDGFRWGLEHGHPFLVQMDADFSHDPGRLPALRAACEGADLVIGSRYVPGGATVNWGLLRKAISRGGSLYARTVLGLPIRDVTGGFKCWRAEALEALEPDTVPSTGFAFQIEMNFRAHRRGLRIQELPIQFPDRVRGTSKMSWRILVEGLLAVWRIRLRKVHGRQQQPPGAR